MQKLPQDCRRGAGEVRPSSGGKFFYLEFHLKLRQVKTFSLSHLTLWLLAQVHSPLARHQKFLTPCHPQHILLDISEIFAIAERYCRGTSGIKFCQCSINLFSTIRQIHAHFAQFFSLFRHILYAASVSIFVQEIARQFFSGKEKIAYCEFETEDTC